MSYVNTRTEQETRNLFIGAKVGTTHYNDSICAVKWAKQDFATLERYHCFNGPWELFKTKNKCVMFAHDVPHPDLESWINEYKVYGIQL